MTEVEARTWAKEALQRAVVKKGYDRDCGDPIVEKEMAKEIMRAYDAGLREGAR